MIVIFDTNILIEFQNNSREWLEDDFNNALTKLDQLHDKYGVRYLIHSSIRDEFKNINKESLLGKWINNHNYGEQKFAQYCFEETFGFLVTKCEDMANIRFKNKNEKDYHPQTVGTETVLKDADIFIASLPFFEEFKACDALILSNEKMVDKKRREYPYKVPHLKQLLEEKHNKKVDYDGAKNINEVLKIVSNFCTK